MKDVVAYTKRLAETDGQKIHLIMTTNATLIDEEKAIFLSDNNIKYLVSIDGDKSTHDKHRQLLSGGSSFEKIRAAFPIMAKYQPWMGARLTICPDTVDKLLVNVQTLADMGFHQFILGQVDGSNEWTAEHYTIYREELIRVARFIRLGQLQGLPLRISTFEIEHLTRGSSELKSFFKGGYLCEATAKLAVAPNGTLYPCAKFISTGDAGEHPYCLGDVNDGISNLYARKDLANDSMSNRQSCLLCDCKESCPGMCPANNFNQNGCIFHAAGVCNYTKMVYVPAIPALTQIAKASSPEELMNSSI